MAEDAAMNNPFTARRAARERREEIDKACDALMSEAACCEKLAKETDAYFERWYGSKQPVSVKTPE